MSGGKILVIDDDEQSLRILTMRLEKAGLDVVTARDGEEGLEMFRREKPDLVVSDVLLPGRDGFEIARELKRDEETRDVPIILLSAFYVSPEDAERGLKLGAAGYYVKPDLILSKPVDGPGLVESVHALLEGKPASEASGGVAQVLVIDDDATALRLLRYRLGALGYEVVEAASGESGLRAFESASPSAVLLDIQMPKMNGIQVLRELRARDPDVAVVMMTAYGSEKIAVDAMKEGASDYLKKPLDNEELEAVLRESVEKTSLRRNSRRLEARLRETSKDLFERILALQEANAELVASNERIAEADRLKGEFLANMSHELRTPLNSILGFSHLLAGRDDLTLDIREDLQAIHGCGQHLLAMIDDILDLARIEAGTLDLAVEEVDVGALVQDVADSLAGLLLGKPIELKLDIADGIPPAHADGKRTRQVLVNLVGNAVKFTERGSITVRVEPEPGDDALLRISVSDTGPGIPEEAQEEIFERFRQLPTSDSASGVGIGLAICRDLIERMGGRIGVESLSGEGATFHLTLPVRRA